MTAVKQAVSLHEDTVQHAVEHADSYRRPHRRATGRRSSRVETVKVDARVLAAAKRLAGGDPSRLRINADGSVLVVNRP